MASNKYTGEVTINLNGKDCTLAFDWRAISALHSKFPADLSDGLLDVAKVNDPLKLAEILAIGLSKWHPDIDAEYIINIAPPLIPLKKPLDEALALAYFGADLMTGIKAAAKNMVDGQKNKSAKKKK